MKHLVWLLFLPGFLCSQKTLEINPDSLVTWKGSCVLIPCQINSYKGTVLRNVSLLWYFQPFYDVYLSEYFGRLLYNSSSSNSRTRSQSASAGRWEFVGSLVNKNCSLKISQLRAEDKGIYGARLFAPYGHPVRQAKWFQNATVHVAASPPDPTMKISSVDIREQWTTVTCSVPYHCPAEPLRLTVSSLEGHHLSSQRRTFNNRMIQTVVGFQVTWTDHGKSLVCSLETQQGSELSKSTMRLDVKYAPKNVRLTASPGTTVREGETLSLECMINSSNPEVSEYLWYMDGQPMNEWPKLKNKIEFQTKGDRHSGAYSCKAKNSVGSQDSEALVIDVQYPPKEAKIERWPEGDITEGDRAGLTCFSKGNPPIASYEWYKIPQTDVIQKSQWLQFDAIQLENAGTYYCVVNNSLGHLESSPFTLAVLSLPQNPSATPTAGLEATAETEGPQSSPPPPSTSEGVSPPLSSTSCPPLMSELPPSWAPIPPLPSPQTPRDGRTLWEEFRFLSDALDQAAKAQNQFIHGCKDLTLATVHLTEQFRTALLQIQQKTCRAPGEKENR